MYMILKRSRAFSERNHQEVFCLRNQAKIFLFQAYIDIEDGKSRRCFAEINKEGGTGKNDRSTPKS